jgi:ribosome-associated translation inhibitor RaiA
LALSAQAETHDLYAVIDLLTDRIDSQLKSHVGKSKSRQTRALSTSEATAAAEDAAGSSQSL